MPDAVVVRAPATSANLGPGFDCLGLALDLWNEVRASPGGSLDPGNNLILRSANAVFEQVGAAYPGFELRSTNGIPFARGLGSSAAAIASGLLIANHCLGRPLDQPGLVQLATALEGHPDNVVPCLLGGARVATLTQTGQVVEARIPIALSLHAVVFVPEQSLPTAHARGLLPPTVPLADALFNVARSSLLVAALASGQADALAEATRDRLHQPYRAPLFNVARSSLLVAALASGQADALAEATRDRLHQPYRAPLFPVGATLLDTAMQAGALGAFISGAGPSVLALCGDEIGADTVAAAFEITAHQLSVPGASLRLAFTDRGAHVVG